MRASARRPGRQKPGAFPGWSSSPSCSRSGTWCSPFARTSGAGWCALVSTACYVVLFIDARLYMEAVLNVFYFGMAVYGWTVWTSGVARDAGLPVVRWPARVHIGAITVVVLLALVNGALLSRYTDAWYPYIDSLTTWAAIWTTFLVARKVLENWWYWLAIDAASAVIFWARELPLTALLFVFYVMLIPVGLVSWTRDYRGRQPART
ncbi:MAG: nicotinamide riboside transporter PnuC [Woeseiaceae bacterium]|nr:nicotinamide riboside transporter PnuC [Woeseiaceae bacterium]